MSVWPSEPDACPWGRCELTPGDAVAGQAGTWTFTYRVGAYGLDIGARIKLVWRLASDWQTPQVDDPAGPAYARVECSDLATQLRARFDPRGHTRPWSQALVLAFGEESVAPGETVRITLGDRSGGGPGCRAQSFVDPDFAFQLLVDPFGTGEFSPAPGDLRAPVRAGRASRLRVLGPSLVRPGEPFRLHVRAEDAWGNPAAGFRGRVTFPNWDLAPAEFDEAAAGIVTVETTAAPGTHRIEAACTESEARDGAPALRARSNPLICREQAGPNLYWGDIHGQTSETVGSGTIAGYFPFARRYGCLDYAAHCANDFQVEDETFERLRAAVRQHHEPGRFVTFLSYEWSANTPAGGDHNVYFLHDDAAIHRSSGWQIASARTLPSDLFPLRALYAAFRGRDDVLIIPHVGGRRADLTYLDPALTPFVEVCSVHGRFDWFARDALRLGWPVGIAGGSDDHSGRPGAAFPTAHTFGARGGLMATRASALTRNALWQAWHSRQVYATSGERIFLEVAVNGAPMGTEVRAEGERRLAVTASGTAAIASIEVWRGAELWRRVDTRPGDPASGRLRIAWQGARSRGRARALRWDGGAELSAGALAQVRPLGMESPLQGVTHPEPRRVAWRSATVGEMHGALLDLAPDTPADAILRISTPALQAEVALADLREQPRRWTVDGVDAGLAVGWEPAAPRPWDVSETWIDDTPLAAPTPYWVRVLQEDGHTAWSSPVFVHAGAAGVPNGPPA